MIAVGTELEAVEPVAERPGEVALDEPGSRSPEARRRYGPPRTMGDQQARWAGRYLRVRPRSGQRLVPLAVPEAARTEAVAAAGVVEHPAAAPEVVEAAGESATADSPSAARCTCDRPEAAGRAVAEAAAEAQAPSAMVVEYRVWSYLSLKKSVRKRENHFGCVYFTLSELEVRHRCRSERPPFGVPESRQRLLVHLPSRVKDQVPEQALLLLRKVQFLLRAV